MTDIYEISSQLVDDVVALSPDTATRLGIPGSDHLWDDTSPDGMARLNDLGLRYRQDIENLNGSNDKWHQHGRRVLADFLIQGNEAYEHGSHFYRLRHTAGMVDDIRDVFDMMDTSSAEGWDNIATRLETVAKPLQGWRATFDEGRRTGHVVARRQVASVVEQLRHLAGPSSKWLGLTKAVAKDHPDRAARISAAVDAGRNAVNEFADYVEHDYAPEAAEADGVGAERYIVEADRFLGLKIDPVETYEWGWSEVNRIHQAMTEVARLIDPDRDLSGVVDLLETDPQYLTANPQEFVEFIQILQDNALSQLDGTHFDVPAEIRKVTVNMVPPGAALGAYYLQPSEDFSRPGGIWYSFGERQQLPLWGEVSTAYHEGFPGHHLQIGTSMAQREKLTRAHRLFVWYPGYGEGWALYTERLMDELGYFERPQYLLGMLSAQQLRACRVVIDIGSHLHLDIPKDGLINPGGKWDFGTGLQMLHQIAGLPLDQAESEIKRYLGWPGQAIGYKVGERVILDIRDRAKREQRDAFDLKSLHRDILEGGEVRLDYLQKARKELRSP